MKTLLERFWLKVSKDDSGCWLWVGTVNRGGYGMKWDGERVIPAHRWSYLHFVGPIPADYQIDHLCRVRHCVKPEHLEAVTAQVNSQRSTAGEVNGARQSAKTHCPQGHPYTEENSYWRPDGRGKNCRTCTYERNRARRLARQSVRG